MGKLLDLRILQARHLDPKNLLLDIQPVGYFLTTQSTERQCLLTVLMYLPVGVESLWLLCTAPLGGCGDAVQLLSEDSAGWKSTHCSTQQQCDLQHIPELV